MSCNDVDFIALNLTRKSHFWFFRENPISKQGCHIMSAVRVQFEFLGDLRIRQIEPHKVQAQNPNSKGLMVARKNGAGEIIELTLAVTASVSLSLFLSFIKTTPGNIAGVTRSTPNPFGPAHPTHFLKAFPIVHQKL